MAPRLPQSAKALAEDPDLVEFASSSQRTKPCKTSRISDELSEEDRRKFLKALSHPEVTVNGLMDFLSRRGLSVSDFPLRRHRDRRCSCYRGITPRKDAAA